VTTTSNRWPWFASIPPCLSTLGHRDPSTNTDRSQSPQGPALPERDLRSRPAAGWEVVFVGGSRRGRRGCPSGWGPVWRRRGAATSRLRSAVANPGVVVREAVAEDRPKIEELRRRWSSGPSSERFDPSFSDRFAGWFDSELAVRKFWVAEIAEVAVGMVNLFTFERMPRPGESPSRWGYLGNMFVVPEQRGSTAAGLLVQAVIGEARSQGHERIVLSPSERSVSFWRRAGFTAADELLVYRL
jgi:N-acetylglutamate synthase-like GNAT family acetyltransferase